MGARTVGYIDDMSAGSSSSGRSSSGGGFGGSRSSVSSVPRHILLKRRVLDIAKFAREQARGGNASLSAAERVRLYGGSVIPVPVPLLPGENEAQHERSFLSYLAERGYSLASLRDDQNKERSMRTSFAKTKTQEWLRDQRYDAASTVAAGKRGRASSFNEENGASEDEENEFDTANSVGASRKRPRRDSTPICAAPALLRTRVLSVSEYRDEVLRGHKLTEGERRQRYGSATEPIPVPLFPGETVDDYEHRFQAHLARVAMDLSRLRNEPNTERSIRMTFARDRLRGGPPPPLIASKPPIVLEAALPTPRAPRDPAKPSILSRVSDIPGTDRLVSSQPAETAVVEPSTEPTDPKLRFPSSCSLRPPPPGSNDTALPKAYLACGCRKCLLRCTSRLVRQIAELQQDVEAAKVASAQNSNSNGQTALLMDLTSDTDTNSGTPSSIPPSPASVATSVKGVDVTKILQITSLIRNRRHAASSTGNRLALTSGNDPIEDQLRAAYDEINEQILANERVLESEALALAQHTTALSDHHYRHDQTQLEEASRTQDENQEMRACIEEEKDHRDAALAVLIVYTWRHAPQELQQRLTHASAADVSHVTRACHHKCAALASELRTLQTQACELKEQLDAVLSGEASALVPLGGEEEQDEDLRRLMELQRLGEQLTHAEAAMQQVHSKRQRELATLLHFDAHVRGLAAALLREAGPE